MGGGENQSPILGFWALSQRVFPIHLYGRGGNQSPILGFLDLETESFSLFPIHLNGCLRSPIYPLLLSLLLIYRNSACFYHLNICCQPYHLRPLTCPFNQPSHMPCQALLCYAACFAIAHLMPFCSWAIKAEDPLFVGRHGSLLNCLWAAWAKDSPLVEATWALVQFQKNSSCGEAIWAIGEHFPNSIYEMVSQSQ